MNPNRCTATVPNTTPEWRCAQPTGHRGLHSAVNATFVYEWNDAGSNARSAADQLAALSARLRQPAPLPDGDYASGYDSASESAADQIDAILASVGWVSE